MKLFGNRILICFLVSIVVGEANGTCPFTRYFVNGKVIESENNKSAAKVKIYVFFDDQPTASLEASTETTKGRYSESPDYSVTNVDGTFHAVSFFNSWNPASKVTDICNQRPGRIEVIALKEGYVAKRKILKHEEMVFDPKNPHTIDMGVIEIHKDIPLP
jgi:hypothetical protein